MKENKKNFVIACALLGSILAPLLVFFIPYAPWILLAGVVSIEKFTERGIAYVGARQGSVEDQKRLAGIDYDHGDYAGALEWYRAAAKQGDLDARIRLGKMYEAGRGVTKDYAEAIKWYLPAAKQGLADAELSLGKLYDGGGPGVSQDHVEAIKWFRKAAEHGDAEYKPKAQYEIGYYFAKGLGVKQDYPAAADWWRKCVDGEPKCRTGLGELYEEGRGVKRDLGQAYVWYSSARSYDPIALDGATRLKPKLSQPAQ